MKAERVAVFGGDALHASVAALGFVAARDDPCMAVIDLTDPGAVAGAADLKADVPRVFVCPESQRQLLLALGIAPERMASEVEPALLGPTIARTYPSERGSATRAVAVTGLRGGVGRTLLVTNLARRIATRMRVCVIDATGTGTCAWWLRCDARPWPELEPLADELTADQLAIVASEAMTNVRVVGGRGSAPSRAVLEATVRVATHLDELVIVDLPLAFDASAQRLSERVDRRLVLAYDEPLGLDTLDTFPLDDSWLIASQSSATKLGRHDVFRALPRDERALRAALPARAAVAGTLGRAYDDLADLLVVDAT